MALGEVIVALTTDDHNLWRGLSRAWLAALAWLLTGLSPAAAAAASLPAAAAAADVRVLVDVSGSMRQNDPQNLRAPALRLLVGLLPEGSQAGVWSFDQAVAALAPVARVNDRWRAAARRGAARIHSRGAYTNIGAALEQALRGWSGRGQQGQRSIILLTDGMVDVGQDPGANQAARTRIVDQLLPGLHELGVTLYTIALSEHADHELLTELASVTGGWYERAGDAGQLERLFLHMFEKAAPPDTVPLTDNRFTVDSSIREMTVLVFRRPGAAPTYLLPPDGQRFAAGAPPPGVRWAAEEGYDLITVRDPAPGQWQVAAETDPDNRVMIVTDLQLEVTPLPNHLLMGETLDLSVRLAERGETVKAADFLRVVDGSLSQAGEDGQIHDWQLQGKTPSPEVQAAEGVYTVRLDSTLRPGRQEFTVIVDGKSFQRQQLQTVLVHENAIQARVDPAPEAGEDAYTVSVHADPQLVDPQQSSARARIRDGQGQEVPLELRPDGADGWSAAVAGIRPDARYTVAFDVHAVTRQGRIVELQPAPVELHAGPPPETPPPAPEPGPTQGHPWWVSLGMLAALNLLLAGTGYWGYRRFRARRGQRIAKLTAELDR